MKRVGIFWDYENCRTPARMSGYTVAGNIRRASAAIGDEISTFKAYVDVHLESSSKTVQQTELQASGVTLVHCPHASRKEVADRVLLVDLMVFALECENPASVVLITGDRDFTYAISVLRMKGHDVFVIFPSLESTHHGLKHLATGMLSWKMVLQCESSALAFDRAVSNIGSTDLFPDRICQQTKAQSSKPTPPRLLCRLSTPKRPSKASTPTPLSAMLSRYVKHSPDKRSVLSDASNDPGFDPGVDNDRSADLHKARQTLGSASSSYANTAQTQRIGLTMTETVETVALTTPSSLPNAPFSSVLPGFSPVADYPVIRDSTVEIDGGASCVAANYVPGSSALQNSSNACQGKESTIVSTGNTRTVSSLATKELFAVLIEILLRERANGRMSTPCDFLNDLLRDMKPTIFQDAGVTDLREYLGLAQNAGIVVFSDVLWDNHKGWVSLRNPLDYSFGHERPDPNSCDNQSLLSRHATAATIRNSQRRKRQVAISSGDDVLTGKTSASQLHSQARTGNRFARLIGISRNFRSRGKK